MYVTLRKSSKAISSKLMLCFGLSVFLPIAHSPFSKLVNQIKKESKYDTLWKPQIAEGNAGKY